MIATLLGGIWAKLSMLAVLAVSLLGVVLAIRKGGVDAQQKADLKSTLKHVENAHVAATDVARLSDNAVTDELHNEFGRD